MKTAASQASKELRVGFMRRFDPAYDQLIDACARIGSPILASATIAAGIRPKHLMHDATANGGPIIDMCCHVFNLWEGLLGCNPSHVSAQGYTFSENKIELTSIDHKALDSAHITLHYPNGAFGHIQVSWGLPWGVPTLEEHTYLAPEGIVQTSWNEHISHNSGQGVTRWQRQGDLNYLDPWRREILQFYRELTTDTPQQVASAADGIEALKVSLAVLESIKTKQPVNMATFGLTP
jgi:myo-inositol 2-dehydrogenase/D-chiro-inositol 1-dehydrogenase